MKQLQAVVVTAAIVIWALGAVPAIYSQPCDDIHFLFTTTEDYYAIQVDSVGADCMLEVCDEIGVFDGDLCVGAAVYMGQWPIAIQAWEDDPITEDVIDGYIEGNEMSFRIWKHQSDTEHSDYQEHYILGNGTFGYDIYAEIWLECPCQPPGISCPEMPIDVLVCDPGEVCVELLIVDYEVVDAGDASWANDLLCFTATASGAYDFRVIASSSCGADTCDLTINVQIGERPIIGCPETAVDTAVCEPIEICVDMPIENYSQVSAEGGTWAEDLACLIVDTSGTYRLVVTAVNDCGTTTCSLWVIAAVGDVDPPMIQCPPDTMIGCSDDVPIVQPQVIDNCDPQPVLEYFDTEFPGDCPSEWTIVRKWVATDFLGNSDTCEMVITIQDTTPPAVDCPPDTVIDCDDSTDPSNTGTATATDNCTASPVVTYSDVQNGDVITRTWTATDDCGNTNQCDQTITLTDVTAPVATCPSDTTVECIADVPAADVGLVSVTDNCDPSPVVTHISDVSDGNSCPEVITRTYRVTDASGNWSECTQLITVDDTTVPVVTCPSDTVIPINSSYEPECTGGYPVVTDNCDPSPSVTYRDSSLAGGIVRIWSSEDDCGNTSMCMQAIGLGAPEYPIDCPGAAIDAHICGPDSICIDLPIVENAQVDVQGDAVWHDDQLCFFAATAGTYSFAVTATVYCGTAYTCDITVNVEMTPEVQIDCPDVPINMSVCIPVEVCVDLDIENYNQVSVNGATWDDGQLCFDADQYGTYVFEVVASNECGDDTCMLTVELDDSCECLGGRSVFEPDTLYAVFSNAIDPIILNIFVGDFETCDVDDIDEASILINGSVVPSATMVVPIHPDFLGEVLKITFPAKEFLETYGVLWDWSDQPYTVSGMFTNGAEFMFEDMISIFGHRSGDANGNGYIDLDDIMYLVTFIFADGSAPDPIELGDADCSGVVDIDDVVFLIDYVFSGGPEPSVSCL
ncbi:MAG: hypothetical protein KKH67_16095 [candidate division Zixibacteria bacterium]|nr:hypothetical protein [candidate division Zixibacteria bacterium]MBU1469887.1 hypothetical protein [candidate division Zixibacteria bacterium]